MVQKILGKASADSLLLKDFFGPQSWLLSSGWCADCGVRVEDIDSLFISSINFV